MLPAVMKRHDFHVAAVTVSHRQLWETGTKKFKKLTNRTIIPSL